VRADDVLNFVAKMPAPEPVVKPKPQLSTDFVDMPLTNVRSVIAKRLLQSKQTIPHYYLSIDLEIDNALK
jgi:pyruvate dehydrogenase E2 component (dihydrolipoamide acetyltransferase)